MQILHSLKKEEEEEEERRKKKKEQSPSLWIPQFQSTAVTNTRFTLSHTHSHTHTDNVEYVRPLLRTLLPTPSRDVPSPNHNSLADSHRYSLRHSYLQQPQQALVSTGPEGEEQLKIMCRHDCLSSLAGIRSKLWLWWLAVIQMHFSYFQCLAHDASLLQIIGVYLRFQKLGHLQISSRDSFLCVDQKENQVRFNHWLDDLGSTARQTEIQTVRYRHTEAASLCVLTWCLIDASNDCWLLLVPPASIAMIPPVSIISRFKPPKKMRPTRASL